MDNVEDFNDSEFLFEDFYFKADTTSLIIFLSEDSYEGRELEIEFNPSPICYRYTLEEYLSDDTITYNNDTSDFCQTFDASDWMESFSLEQKLDTRELRHYKFQVCNQTFDVLSNHKPNICWREQQMQKTSVGS